MTKNVKQIQTEKDLIAFQQWREYDYFTLWWGFNYTCIEVRFEKVQFSKDKSPMYQILPPYDKKINVIEGMGFARLANNMKSMIEIRKFD